MVLLSNKHFRSAALRAAATQKLHGKYSGPFQIVRKVSPTAYELDLPANIKIHPTINIEYLKEYHASPERLGPRDAPLRPDALLTSDGSAEYEVERILAHRHDPREGFTYLVLWKGYGLHDATWEPESNLINARDVVREYLRSNNLHDHSQPPAKRGYRQSRRRL
ncbi:hypothetical protein NliqN6_1326 [Naganishia liquefaciens]|uniref:Chromo domain-containing protein n=1 Tax=Naganishia liquefaciens TaxID=104408 RepID=A0A8H3YD45_9TREE|nr:hypothetical protein NliqN6_1326 [Naganishia liquefaciens]